MFIGLLLGIFIGLISASIFVMLIVQLAQQAATSNGAQTVAQVCSIPAFCFGGPWLAGIVLEEVEWSELIVWYLTGLVATKILVAALPLVAFVRRAALQAGGATDV